jgi:hypothetical protein
MVNRTTLRARLLADPSGALRAASFPPKQSFFGASVPGLAHKLSPRGVCSRIPHLPPGYRIYGLSSMYCLNEKTVPFKTLILYHIKGFNPNNQNYKTCKGCAGFTPKGAQGFGKDCVPFIGVLMHNLLQTTSSIGNNHNNL